MKKGGRERKKVLGCQKLWSSFSISYGKTWMTFLINPAEWMLRVNQWVQMEFWRWDQCFTTTTVKWTRQEPSVGAKFRKKCAEQDIRMSSKCLHWQIWSPIQTLAEQPSWAHYKAIWSCWSPCRGPSLTWPFYPSASLWVSRNINRPSQIPAYRPVTSLLSKHLSPFKTKSNSNLPCETVLILCAGRTCQSFLHLLETLTSAPETLHRISLFTQLPFPTTIISTTAHRRKNKFQTKQLLLHTISLDVRQLQECLIDLAAHWHRQRSRPHRLPSVTFDANFVLKLTLPYSCMAIANPGKPPDPKTPSERTSVPGCLSFSLKKFFYLPIYFWLCQLSDK